MADTPQGHWWEAVTAIASLSAGLIAFLRGLQASRQRVPLPPNDDIQTRVATLERENRLMQDALHDMARWRYDQERVRTTAAPVALPSPSDLR